MYKQVMSSMEGIELYPIITLVIFFTFFTLMILKLFVFTEKDGYGEHARLPLEDPTQDDDSHSHNKF